MKKILLCAVLLLALACRKKLTRGEVEAHLRKAMTESLYKKVGDDSSKVKYQIQQVYFYEEAKFYDCEFKVKMVQSGHDTTGVMKANISKDFLDVKRVY